MRASPRGLGPERERLPRTDDHRDELLLISRLLDDLHAPAARGQRREIVAPTRVLGPVIRGAAVEAVERLCDAVGKFAADKGEARASMAV